MLEFSGSQQFPSTSFASLEKKFYKFNEVTSLSQVKPYVLRFWESEFDQINPRKNENGQKLYTKKDLEAIDKIKELLFAKKLSIPQAKGYLEREYMLMETESDSEDVLVSTLASRSEELKQALEKIIERNSMQEQDEIPSMEVKASEPLKLPKLTELCDKDIVNLVSAKKKLTVLKNKINSICEQHSWV